MQKYEAVEFQQFSNWYHKLCFATPLVKKKFQNQRHFENLCPEIEMFIHRPSILKPMEISYAYFLPSLNFQVISCMISRVKATRKSSNELSPSNDHNGNDIVKIAIRNLSLDLRTVINSAVITFFKILHFRILVRFDFDKFCFESGFTIRKNYYSEFSYIDRFSLKKLFLTSFKMTRSVNKSISYDRCKKFSYKRFESKRKTKKNLALKEIKFYQKTTGLLINKLPFMRYSFQEKKIENSQIVFFYLQNYQGNSRRIEA